MKNKNTIIVNMIFFLSAMTGCMFLSKAISPLYNICGGDAAIFMTIGKHWAEGGIPYAELFDHKGPIIYIINAIGYAISGDKIGIFFVEVFFIFITEVFTYRMLKRYLQNRYAVLLTILFPSFLMYNWGSGNLTEGYMLPFLVISYDNMLKWNEHTINKKEGDHPANYALIYGIAIGFAIMTRMTNAISVIVGVAYITIYLILTKRWSNLLRNAFMFVIGLLVIIFPFCIYFCYKGALYEMWYATILYNIEYTVHSGMEMPTNFHDMIALMRMCLAGWSLVAVVLWRIFVKFDLEAVFWGVISTVHLAMIYSLNCSPNYSICLIPYIYINNIGKKV